MIMPIELEESTKEHKGTYSFEITTTNNCNFRCSYCFEKGFCAEKPLINSEIISKRVNELFEQDWFKEKYSCIKLHFWGGEPTLNSKLIKDLIFEFENDPRVCFFVYTNGSTLCKFLPIFKSIKDNPVNSSQNKKIDVQISYDGNPIHDLRRVDSFDIGTSFIVKDAIRQIAKSGVKFGLKSTVIWKDYELIPKAWDDIEFLHDHYSDTIRYSLTVDYYNVNITPYWKKVEDTLIKIAQKEWDFYTRHGYLLSNIFRSSGRAVCSTGKHMLAINTNGDIFYCHGGIYSKCSDELKYSNIFDDNFINSIREVNELIDNEFEPEECRQCISQSCLRCNVKKYEESNKHHFKDRWFDYTDQEQLCKYYRMVEKVGQALKDVIKEK